MTSYSWSITTGNGTIVGSNSGSSVNVTAGAAGSFTLTLTTTLATCSTTCSKTVTVDPATTYSCDIAGPSEICKGSSDVFTAPPNLNSYSWNVTGNASIIGSNTSASVTVSATIPGSYTISLQTKFNGVACSSAKTVNVIECANACTYTQGFYGNRKGNACYNNTGTTMNSSELMLNAFGAATSQVFGNAANKRFFTLFKSDISSGAIYKMLPGGGNAKAIDVDNVSPFDGAYYSDETTWALVPLQSNNPQKGRIRNSLLAQTITLWFNLRNSSTLGSISLVNDTLVTQGTTKCGSSTLVGEPDTLGLPHSIVVYLNGSNGYPATASGLFALANDVLGGVPTSVSASDVTEAVDLINNAFDGCRVLIGTIPYSNQLLTRTIHTDTRPGEKVDTKALKVIAYPNPYQHRFQLIINSPVSGMTTMEFYSLSGQKVYEMKKPVMAGLNSTTLYTGPSRFSTLFYKVTIEKYVATGIVLKPN
jgi:hypothetical protein